MRLQPISGIRQSIRFVMAMVVLLFAFLYIGYKGGFPKGAPIDGARVEERIKNLDKAREAATKALNEPTVVNAYTKIVSLPIEQGLEVALQEMKDPKAARSILLKRLAQSVEQPPAAPAAPSAFE